MSSTTTQELLDLLAEFQAQKDLIRLEKHERINEVIPPEIRNVIDDIELEFSSKLESVDDNIAILTDQIKNEVLRTGESVKGAHLLAVYTKGRVSWDTKILDGLMIAIPSLAKARKEGEPSVSIRKVSGG